LYEVRAIAVLLSLCHSAFAITGHAKHAAAVQSCIHCSAASDWIITNYAAMDARCFMNSSCFFIALYDSF